MAGIAAEAMAEALQFANATSDPLHPYYPLGLELAGYLANEYSVLKLLGIFAAGCAVIFGISGVLVKQVNPTIRRSELLTVMWFVLSGTIHLFFEGYYSYNYKTMAASQHLFGQLWKEYALSDSRYLTQDPFVLCMETTTAFVWGPLCYIVACMIPLEHPLRHPLQIIVSLGQFYGDVLYYSTSYFNSSFYGLDYSRPEPYYFYGYYVLMNFFWIVIPGLLIWNSSSEIGAAFRATAELRNGKKKA